MSKVACPPPRRSVGAEHLCASQDEKPPVVVPLLVRIEPIVVEITLVAVAVEIQRVAVAVGVNEETCG